MSQCKGLSAIAEILQSRVAIDNDGYYWIGPQTDIEKQNRENSLGYGNGGIILFLLLAYEQSKNENFLRVAINAGKRIARKNQENPLRHFGLRSGNMGIVLIYLYLFRITNDPGWQKLARTTAKPCMDEFLSSRFTTDQLGDGRAGVLLTLLLLHQYKKSSWIKDAICRYLTCIISNSRKSKDGIWWPDYYSHINGLNGFFDGAAGIGLALLITGEVLKDKYITYLGRQAFQYVSSTYDRKHNDWKHFNNAIRTKEDYLLHKQKLQEGDLDFFQIPNFTNRLAEGSAGIRYCCGMAFSITKDPFFMIDATEALSGKAIRSSIHQENHFSGQTISLEMILVSSFINEAETVIEHYLDMSEIEVGKEGLVGGLTATSIWRNKLLEGHSIEELERRTTNLIFNGRIENLEARLIYLSARFPRTIAFLRHYEAMLLNDYLNTHSRKSNDIEEELFSNWLNKIGNGLIPPLAYRLKDLFALEQFHLKFSSNYQYHSLHYISSFAADAENRSCLRLSEENFSKLTLRTRKGLAYFGTKWNWTDGVQKHFLDGPTNFREEMGSGSDDLTIVLWLNEKGEVVESVLDDLQESLLCFFSQAASVQSSMEQLEELFEDTLKTDIHSIIGGTIKRMLQTGLLEIDKR